MMASGKKTGVHVEEYVVAAGPTLRAEIGFLINIYMALPEPKRMPCSRVQVKVYRNGSGVERVVLIPSRLVLLQSTPSFLFGWGLDEPETGLDVKAAAIGRDQFASWLERVRCDEDAAYFLKRKLGDLQILSV
jgi:hypothetical protein